MTATAFRTALVLLLCWQAWRGHAWPLVAFMLAKHAGDELSARWLGRLSRAVAALERERDLERIATERDR